MAINGDWHKVEQQSTWEHFLILIIIHTDKWRIWIHGTVPVKIKLIYVIMYTHKVYPNTEMNVETQPNMKNKKKIKMCTLCRVKKGNQSLVTQHKFVIVSVGFECIGIF